MSLTALFDRLGALLPKYFIIGAFMPVLIFGFLNGLLCYQAYPWFHGWVSVQILSSKPSVFTLSVILIGASVFAYLLSAINGFLREVLEGRRILNRFNPLLASQQEKLSNIENNYYKSRKEAADITRKKSQWMEDMQMAAEKGVQNKNTLFNAESSKSSNLISLLKQKKDSVEPIGYKDIENAVANLTEDLTTYSINFPNKNGVNLLEDLRNDLYYIFDYALDYWNSNELISFNARSRFGIGEVAPTAFGNVGASIRAYGISRYGIDFDTYWSRLQPILATNKDFFGNLQDAKTQLDSIVACCWLSIFTTIYWVPALAWTVASPWLFLFVAIGGPLVAWLCYTLAVESYVVFAELVRTSLDLYRFQLLQSLHIALPTGLRDERVLWGTLRRISAFGQEAVDISYQFDTKGGSG